MSLGHLNFRFGRPVVTTRLQEHVTRRYLAIYKRGPRKSERDCAGCSGLRQYRTLDGGDARESARRAEFHLADLMLKGEPLPEPSMGLDDVVATGIAEWMVVRLRLGGDRRSPMEMCRPCPGRYSLGSHRAHSNAKKILSFANGPQIASVLINKRVNLCLHFT